MDKTRFEWDTGKDAENLEKHGVSFSLAQYAFADSKRAIAETLPTATPRRDTFASARLTGTFLPFALPIAAVFTNNWRRLLAERQGYL